MGPHGTTENILIHICLAFLSNPTENAGDSDNMSKAARSSQNSESNFNISLYDAFYGTL